VNVLCTPGFRPQVSVPGRRTATSGESGRGVKPPGSRLDALRNEGGVGSEALGPQRLKPRYFYRLWARLEVVPFPG